MQTIKQINYDDIFLVWSNFLWPNRTNIKHMSSMLFMSGYDIDIYTNYQPVFLGLFDNNTLVAVNSCHQTSETDYRSRGLWVDPQYRGKGLGKKILCEVDFYAAKAGCIRVWSLPRYESRHVYESAGYVIAGTWHQTDTSINAYAVKDLL
jgi:GNAT superfamily N-acetyltransferase